MEPYGLYRASVPVQYSYTSTPPMGRTACTEPQCLYSTAIPLLPLLAVRPVQSLSACTVQLYLYSPIGRTACTEPQCLYSRAIPPLPLLAVRPVQSLSACTRLHFTLPLITPVMYTYLLTPWSRVFLEKLTRFQLVNKFPAFYGTRRFITAFTSARHMSLSRAISIHSMPPHPTS